MTTRLMGHFAKTIKYSCNTGGSVVYLILGEPVALGGQELLEAGIGTRADFRLQNPIHPIWTCNVVNGKRI